VLPNPLLSRCFCLFFVISEGHLAKIEPLLYKKNPRKALHVHSVNRTVWRRCEDVVIVLLYRMAPEVIACDEDPDATYDNRVSLASRAIYVFRFTGVLQINVNVGS